MPVVKFISPVEYSTLILLFIMKNLHVDTWRSSFSLHLFSLTASL